MRRWRRSYQIEQRRRWYKYRDQAARDVEWRGAKSRTFIDCIRCVLCPTLSTDSSFFLEAPPPMVLIPPSDRVTHSSDAKSLLANQPAEVF